MNRTEFEQVQEQYRNSGRSLKSFLKEIGVSYTTYNYWRKKLETERQEHPITPTTIRERRSGDLGSMLPGIGLSGVTLAFPNGLKVHFVQGSEMVLLEVLSRSLC